MYTFPPDTTVPHGLMGYTAHQIDREVSFASTVTFIIGNVTLDFTKKNEKVKKKSV